MGKMFKIDVSGISSLSEKNKITQSFLGNWEIMDQKWIALGLQQRTLICFNAFWSSDSDPEFPDLPKEVKITML